MHLFPELKCLYFEGNGIKKIEGLETNVQLVSLYLQENLISRIENIHTLSNLHTLQLSDNCITTVENLSFNFKLDSLYLKSNRLGRNGVSDLIGLLECPSIACLDIQSNNISDVEVLDEVLVKMPKLKVLYMQNNEITKKIPSYRKTVIAKIPTLMYLDDRPVFEEDRRHAEAFARGGIEAEREERAIIKREKDEKH